MMTLREIGSRYGLEYATVHARLHSRGVPYGRVGNVIVVKIDDVDKLIAMDVKVRKHAMYRRWYRNRPHMTSRWRDSFSTFVADIGDIPCDGARLVRIDRKRCLGPNNYRWA